MGDMLYKEAARFYGHQLQRVAAVLKNVGPLDGMEPMEAAAVAKTALVQIAFIADEPQFPEEDDAA